MQELTRSSRVTRGRNSDTSQQQSSTGRPSRKSASSERAVYSENMTKRSRKSTSSEKAANSVGIMTTRKRSRNYLSEDESPQPKKSLPEKIPKFRTKIIDGKEFKIDAYCWQCHLPTEELDCPHCIRAYHKHCLKKSKVDSADFCECRLTSVGGVECAFMSGTRTLNETLRYVLIEAAQEKNSVQKKNSGGKLKFVNLLRTWPKLTENLLLAKIIDLDYILDNLNDTTWYNNTADFFADAKWIYHNCCIVYGSDNNITQSAQIYIKNIKQELVDMEACFECYGNRHHNFTNVCKKPHPIVWAKLRGSPFWPAKCLRVNNGHADVRFFGTHDKSVILLDQVFKISHEPPNKNQYSRSPSSRITAATLKLNEAMKELYIYVAEYERTFNLFKYHSSGTPLVHKVRSSSRKGRKRGRSRYRQNDVSMNESISDGEVMSEIEDSDQQIPEKESADVHIRENDTSERGEPEKGSNQILPKGERNKKTQSKDSSINQVKQPSLNLSVLHDATIETKVKAALGMPLSSIAFSKETNYEPSDPMINMVYEVSHETIQDDFIEESPGPKCSFSENQSGPVSVSSIDITSDTDASSSKETAINTNKDKANSGHFVNANTSDSLPVITSAMSPFDVTSTHLVVDDNPLAALTGFSSISTNSDTLASSSTQKLIEMNANSLSQPEEDDIQLVEEIRRQDILTQALKENAPITKTFCELLLSNRPNARRQLAWLQTVVAQCYLQMWLDVNGKKLDANDFNTFYKIYAELVAKMSKLEGENKNLKAAVDKFEGENKDLKAAVDKLNTDVNTLKDQTKIDFRNDIKDELSQAQLVKLNDRITKQKDEIEEKERKLKMYEEEIGNFEKEKDEVEKQLEECQLLLMEKEQEIEQYRREFNKIINNAESQTDISGEVFEKKDYNFSKSGLSENSITNNISKPGGMITDASENSDDYDVIEQTTTLVYLPDPPTTTFQPLGTSVVNPVFSNFVLSSPQVMSSVVPLPTIVSAQQVMRQQNTQVMQATQMTAQQNTQVIQATQMTAQQNTQVLQSSYISSESMPSSQHLSKPLKTYAGSKLRSSSKKHSKKYK